MAEPFNGKEYRQGLHAGYLAAESQDPVKPCPNTHRDFRAGYETGLLNYNTGDVEAQRAEERFGC